MSNPGLVTLVERRIGGVKTIKIEDNLGESIHIHYNGIRLDLTVRELLELSDICDDTIHDLVKVKEFQPDEYPGDFLLEYAECFLDLKSVKTKKIRIQGLRYLTRSKAGIPVTKSLKQYKCAGESHEDYLPVIFNGKPILICGEDYAASRSRISSDGEITVRELCFENNRHTVSAHPWIPFFFSWNKPRLKAFAYSVAGKLRKGKR